MKNYLAEMIYALTSAYNRKDYDNVKRGKPLETNIGKLFSIFAWGLDIVQEQAGLIKLWDNLDNACGSVLDRYGANFGVKRLGTSDEFYRLAIRVKIMSQLSGGDIDTVLNASAALFDIPVERIGLTENFPAKIGIDVNEADLSPEIIKNAAYVVSLLKRILAAGIGLVTTFYSYREIKGDVTIKSVVFERGDLTIPPAEVKRQIRGPAYCVCSMFEFTRITVSPVT